MFASQLDLYCSPIGGMSINLWRTASFELELIDVLCDDLTDTADQVTVRSEGAATKELIEAAGGFIEFANQLWDLFDGMRYRSKMTREKTLY